MSRNMFQLSRLQLNRLQRTRRPARRRSVGFSLVELLVVISIMGLLAAAGIPAIRNMIYTSTGSMAETQLKLALGAARDLAIRNASGDTAAVFTFEPAENGRGRLTIVPMVRVGKILDTKDPERSLGNTTISGYREVFAPSPFAEATQLPVGWMVRGFAPAGYVFDAGNNNEGTSVPSNGWYRELNGPGNRRLNITSDPLANNQPSRGNWVFPETAFYDPEVSDNGQPGRPNSHSTFMVRFQSGTGRIVGADPTPVVVLLPRSEISSTTALSRVQSPAWETPVDWRRIDRTDNLAIWARAVCDQVPMMDASALIGCRSTDAAQAISINIISLYDEAKMASAIGARGLNKVTGTIYGGEVTGSITSSVTVVPKAPNIDVSLWPGGTYVSNAGSPENKAMAVQDLINNYMINALKQSSVQTGGGNTFIDSDARLFTVDAYLGSVSEGK